MKKSKEGRTATYGAITAIIVLIAVIGTMNYYADGWDKHLGLHLQGPSFLTVFLTVVVGGGIIIFSAIYIYVAFFYKPRKNHRINP